MNRKEKLGIAKAGVSAYGVCSAIGWFKEGGFQLINQNEAYIIKFHKTMGIIDVFRLEGHLKDLEVFGGDWLLLFFGMGMSVMAAAVMKLVYYFQAAEKENKTEKTSKGYKVKIK
jgi:hypothetical protein